jgi:hypothetical protein
VATIEQLLHRRTDLSTFLVHLTRTGGGQIARDNLLSMAENNLLEARSALGPASRLEPYLAATSATQKVVCFTETPLEHTWMMLQQIEGRTIQFEPYGLAITKTTARKSHFNPVWYSDISTRGGRSWPMASVNQLVDDAEQRCKKSDGTLDVDALQVEPILRLTPFLEQMGPMLNGGRKEFWWEREWRHVDDYAISFPSRIVALFAPENDHGPIRRDLQQFNERWSRRPILDPSWGVERMVAELTEVAPEEIGPFPEA